MLIRLSPAAKVVRRLPSLWLACAVLSFLFDISAAPSAKANPAVARAAAVSTQPCGTGVSLRLSAVEAPQGGLIAATLVSSSPIAELQASWDGRILWFWTARPWRTGGKEEREALLGVDLEKPAGSYEVQISGQARGSAAFTCQAQIKVHDGHFATESLHVAKQFAEPDPQQVQRANTERDKLRAIFDLVTHPPLWERGFRQPLDHVKTGGNFGKRRILNGIPGSPHSGVDFPAPTGTAIRSAQTGTVVLAEELFFSGNTVVVDHGLGIYTFYGHLSAYGVKLGEVVKRGQILGKVGATGRVTGPHLHWGLYINHARVNGLGIIRLLGKPQPS
jgi:murein DD-endopeptidase MepM/ murein hydrolase activator NlpD